jgi:hypothetical protein
MNKICAVGAVFILWRDCGIDGFKKSSGSSAYAPAQAMLSKSHTSYQKSCVITLHRNAIVSNIQGFISRSLIKGGV